jgi:hypothetical protein
VYAFVLLGFCNAIFVLFNASPAVLDGQVQPVSYQAILTQMVLWVLGEIDFELLEPLQGVNRVLGFGLFWANTMLTVFVLLNLLIAVLNTTYEQVTERAFNEWLFLRLNTMLEFESSLSGAGGLDEYFIVSAQDLAPCARARERLPSSPDRPLPPPAAGPWPLPIFPPCPRRRAARALVARTLTHSPLRTSSRRAAAARLQEVEGLNNRRTVELSLDVNDPDQRR